MKKIFHLVSHPLFAGSMVMIIGNSFVNFINLIYHFLIVRLLIPAEYGELASLLTLITLIGMIPFSLGLVIIKFISAAKTPNETKKIFGWFNKRALFLAFGLTIIVIVTAPITSGYLNIDDKFLIPLIGTAFLFSIPSFLYKSTLQGLIRFKEMVVATLIENIAKLILSLVFLVLGFKLFGAVSAFIMATILGWLFSRRYLKDYISGKTADNIDIKSIFYFSIPVLLNSLSTTALFSTDLIMIKHYFPDHEAGLYAALSKLGQIIYFGAGPVAAVMFPLISKRQSKGESYRKIFLYSLLLSFAISLGILGLYWLVPNLIISVLYGSLYLEASSLLVMMGVFMVLFTLSSLIINFHLSLGKTRIVFLPVIAAVFQLIAINYYHGSLEEVIRINIVTTTLLFGASLVYFFYNSRNYNFLNNIYVKKTPESHSTKNKINLSDSSRLQTRKNNR